MKLNKNLFFLILVFLSASSCKNNDPNPYFSVEFKYLQSDNGKIKIENKKSYCFSGIVFGNKRANACNNMFSVNGYAVAKYFTGSSDKANLFDEKKDYTSPASMPPDSKLGTVVKRLSNEVFSTDMKLYAYYVPAADKDYVFTIKSINFNDVSLGQSAKLNEDITIHINKGDPLNKDVLMDIIMDELHDRGILNSGMSMFLEYKLCGLYNLPNNGVYTAYEAVDLNRLGTEVTSLGSDSSQSYCLGYSKIDGVNSRNLTINYLLYEPGDGEKSSSISAIKRTYPVASSFYTDEDYFAILSDFILNSLSSIVLNDGDVVIYDDFEYNKLFCSKVLISKKINNESDFEYVAPVLNSECKDFATAIQKLGVVFNSDLVSILDEDENIDRSIISFDDMELYYLYKCENI